MGEANADPEVVTALILRESSEAAAHAAQISAPRASAMQYAHFPVRNHAAGETATVAVERPTPDAPVHASSSLWNRQLVFAMALVVVLLAVWVAERRSARRIKEEGHGR